jgi:oxaloacetate decarboxylase alpha subunit
MATIQLVDVSIRDGNQSIWGATGLNTPQCLQIAPIINRVGFRALDFIASTHMGVAVKYYREDPWERIRLMHQLMPDTPLQFIGVGFRFISWETLDMEVMRLVYRCLVRNGISRFVVLEPMHDLDAMLATARMIREEGGEEIIAALTFTLSEAHDDAFYANLAAALAKSPDIDRAYVKDPSGLLGADRARTLIPAIQAAAGRLPLELHSHCTIGLAPYTYTVAAGLGIEVMHVGTGPLGSGTSLPSSLQTVANLRELGHRVDVDDDALARMNDYLGRLARAEGLPFGQPRDFDARFFHHQVAGGVMTTTKRQLDELRLGHLLPEVMIEVDQVRVELGYPIMVTPFPQIVCTQAMFNVIGKERYATVPDQVIRYVLGRFGRPARPVDPNVMDRILARPRARELQDEPPPPSLAELRRRFPPGLSDEEFLLRATMPGDQIDTMKAAGPARTRYNPDIQPVMKLLRELTRRSDTSRVVIDKPGFRLELTGEHSKPAEAVPRAAPRCPALTA